MTRGAPSESEWWNESEMRSKHEGSKSLHDLDTSNQSEDNFSGIRTFQNRGLFFWEKARFEWRKQRVEARPPSPEPIQYDIVVIGITSVVHQNDLPGRMLLSDLVTVFNDVWGYDSDPF